MSQDKTETIVIVGGGTAGWSTAHNFINKTNQDIKIILVATPEIPIIGVGESTTGRFNDLINLQNNLTGVNETEFLKETESTFKLGIKHSDWHTVGKSFYSPIGDNYNNFFKYPHISYDDFRTFHIADGLDYDKTFQSRLMALNKLHFTNDDENIYTIQKIVSEIPVAYHLDTFKVGQYLKKKAIKTNKCKYIDDQVVGFEQDENGFVKHLKTKSGQKVEGDLFVDCTGFARVLINNIEENKWVSYKDNLLVDSALNFNYKLDENEEIRNYTHAWAQKNGWCWEIPTQTRMGCGYVFSSRYTDFDKAYDEISKKLKNRKLKIQKEINFNTGRLEKFWVKNVLSTGLSSAFIEPLEATSIHATIMQINHFIEYYFKNNLNYKCNLFHEQYNSEMTQMWDNIKDFIVYHYITPRKDSEFWKESSDLKRRSSRLKKLMTMWSYKMPRENDYINDIGNNFYYLGNTLWYQIAIGMKLLDPKLAKAELQNYSLYEPMKNFYKKLNDDLDKSMHLFTETNKFYKSIQCRS